VPTRLQESVQRKRPELCPDKWILHRDTAPVHDVLRVLEFLAKKSIAKMDHPSYLFTCSSPLRFLAFSKNAVKGQRFSDIPDIQRNVVARYCKKRFSRLFPAVAPSSHEVHSFTRRVFRRQQQLLLHSEENFSFTGPFWELNCLEEYHICRISKIKLHMNDVCIDIYNPIFETVHKLNTG
jgi:hypothetical protein